MDFGRTLPSFLRTDVRGQDGSLTSLWTLSYRILFILKADIEIYISFSDVCYVPYWS